MKKINSIESLKEFINEKYSNDEYMVLDNNVFKNSTTKLDIRHTICRNIVKMSSHDFRVGHTCPICSKKYKDSLKPLKTGKKLKRTKDEFIRDTINNNPTFSFIGLTDIINGESVVTAICNECKTSTTQKVKYIVNGVSCMKCSRRLTLNNFLDRINNRFPNFYTIDTSEFKDGYVTIKCSLCGKVSRKSIHHILQIKSFCHCPNEINFRNRVKDIYDGEFEYVSGYKTMKSNVIMKHKKCDKLITIRASHFIYDGCRCRRCNPFKNEELIKVFLEENNIEYIPQKTFDKCRYKQKLQFDIFVPKYNILIEYDGEGHYYPVFSSKEDFEISKKRDEIKTSFALKNKIPLLRIPYWEKENINSILSQLIEVCERCTSEDEKYNEIESINLRLSKR